MKVGKESGSLKALAATAQRGKAQLAYEYLHLKFSTSPGNLGGTEDQPEPAPGPNHHQNSIRYILHQERERVVQQLQNRRQIADAAHLHFPLGNLRRQRVNLRSALSTLGPSLHSVATLPHRAAPVRHQSVSLCSVESKVDAPLRCPPHPMPPPSLTPSAPNELPRIQGFQGRRSCCC